MMKQYRVKGESLLFADEFGASLYGKAIGNSETERVDIFMAPDGYYPGGKSRPWRTVELVGNLPEQENTIVTIRYFDTGEQTLAPFYALRNLG
jgi:hypothetical protein